MSKISIVTDSCASIPEKLIEKLNIKIVPYYIHHGEKILRDLVTIQREEFYQWLPTLKKLPKTASPGPGDYVKTYQALIDEGVKEIISIHMTSKGSGAYQAAISAKQMIAEKFPDVKLEVIDTLNVSLCQGWMAIEAAREALRGASFEEVLQCVKAIMTRAQMLQTAGTLKYLHLGGRIGKAKHLVASMLNIKPIISMEDGVIVSLGQTRTIKRVYQRIVAIIEEKIDVNEKIKIAYVHAAAADEAEKLKEIVEERFTCVETLVAELSPALGVHTGPGTVGVCYYPVVDG